jgi:hypothetical protein
VAAAEIPRALARAIDQKIATSFGDPPPSVLSLEQMELLDEIHILATALDEENSKQPKPILEHARRRLSDAHAFLYEGRMQEARQIYDLANALLLDHILRPRKASRESGIEQQRAKDRWITAYYDKLRAAYPTWSSMKVRRQVRKNLDLSEDRGRKDVLDALIREGRIVEIDGQWVDAPAR